MARGGLALREEMKGIELAFLVQLKTNPGLRYLWESKVGKKIPLNHAEPWTSTDAEHFRKLLGSLERHEVCLGSWKDLPHYLDIENTNSAENFTFEKECELLNWYLNVNHFTVLVLDNLNLFLPIVSIPREIFKLSTVECLSLCGNGLHYLPADVGRMHSLKKLLLTGNKLRSDIPALPFTLTFCRQLETLHLDRNSLDAVPGIVTLLPSLADLYRHDNENYFRSTFMWYGWVRKEHGWERKQRVHIASPLNPAWRLRRSGRLPGPAARAQLDTDMPLAAAAAAGEPAAGRQQQLAHFSRPPKLRYLAAQAVAQTKLNFFELPMLSTAAKDYVASVYQTFDVCENCNTATSRLGEGYFTFSFRSSFLGNANVPFQHWSCSEQCARAIERATLEEGMPDPEAAHHGYIYSEEEAAAIMLPTSSLGRPPRRLHSGSLMNRKAAACHRCIVL